MLLLQAILKNRALQFLEPLASMMCSSYSKVELICSNGITGILKHQKQLFLRSEEHTSELQSRPHLVCRLLLEKKKKRNNKIKSKYNCHYYSLSFISLIRR